MDFFESMRIQLLTEMSFSKNKFQQAIVELINPILNHFLKLKMTDRVFSDKIDERLYTAVKPSRTHWIDEIENKSDVAFKFITNRNLKSSTKERVYGLAIIQASPDLASFEQTSQDEELKHIVHTWKQQNMQEIESSIWYQEILRIFVGLSKYMHRNTVEYHKINHAISNFIQAFVKDFDR